LGERDEEEEYSVTRPPSSPLPMRGQKEEGSMTRIFASLSPVAGERGG
jgi:hypothetical protein